MNKKTIITLCGIATLSFSLQGCLVAAIGAGIGAAKWGNSQKAKARSQEEEAYNQYVLGMQKINMERQEKHMKPVPIMTFSDYSKVMKPK
jgi:hypothetical protein